MIPVASLTQSSSTRTDVAVRPGEPSSRVQNVQTHRGEDRVEFSAEARRAAEDQPVRLDLVQRIREQIANGTYETEDKLVIAAAELAKRGFDAKA